MPDDIKVGDVFTIPTDYVVNPPRSKPPYFSLEHWAYINAMVLEAKEEGRREILREIAASTDDPRADHDGWLECIFCGEGDERPHTPNCLWLRALQVTKDAR